MGRFKSAFVQYTLLWAVCLVFYGNTISNDYAYDDSVVITENRFTQQGLSGIPALFANDTFRGSYDDLPTVERYRPLSVATFAVERQLFGQDPHVSHFFNVALLALTTQVLYRLLAKVFGGRDGEAGLFDFPLIATLLFVAHPVHTEVVANIKGRDELLALLGSLSATLLTLRYVDTRDRKLLAWSAIAFLAALFSKENAITFLAVSPLTLYYYRDEPRATYLRTLGPLVLSTALFLVARQLAVGTASARPAVDLLTEPFAYATVSERLATVLYTFGRYLQLLFFPHPLTIDYYPFHVQLTGWANWEVWFSLLAYAAATAYALASVHRKSVIAYGILVYLFTFSVVSNLPFSIGTFMSERFLFMPSLGFAIVLAWLLSTRIAEARPKILVVAAILVPCAAATYERNRAWKDDFTLFTTDVKTSRDSIKGNLAAAVTYLTGAEKAEDGETVRRYRSNALEHAQRAVSVYEANVDVARAKGPSYANVVMLLGDAYQVNEMIPEALGCYRRAAPSLANREGLLDAVERALARSSDVDLKIQTYSDLLALEPDHFLINYRLGYLYGKEKNDLARAVRYLQRAVDLRPDEPHALEALSFAYKMSREYEKAALYLERVAAQRPEDSSYATRLLTLYKLSGNQAKEQELLERLPTAP